MIFILILLITVKNILPIFGDAGFYYRTDHVSHHVHSSGPLVRSLIDRNLKIRNVTKNHIHNITHRTQPWFWDRVKNFRYSNVPTTTTSTTTTTPSTTTPTALTSPSSSVILNVTSMCQNEKIVLVDITGSVATIAKDVRENRLENRMLFDKLSGQSEDVMTRSSNSKNVDLLSIDTKIDAIISTLSVLTDNLIEHGGRLKSIENQLKGLL